MRTITREHLVSAPGTTAATPHGTYEVERRWIALVEGWIDDARPVSKAVGIVDLDPSRGPPVLPSLDVAPTAGRQLGEKLDVLSSAFEVGKADVDIVDASLVLNFSAQLDTTGAGDIGRAMMRSAVAVETDRQVGAALVSRATPVDDLGAAFAHFDSSRFLPRLLLVPPSGLFTVGAGGGGAGGTTLVEDPPGSGLYVLSSSGGSTSSGGGSFGVRVVCAHISAPVLLDPSAVLGWVVPVSVVSVVDPSLLGTSHAYSSWGEIAVDSTGCATWTG